VARSAYAKKSRNMSTLPWSNPSCLLGGEGQEIGDRLVVIVVVRDCCLVSLHKADGPISSDRIAAAVVGAEQRITAAVGSHRRRPINLFLSHQEWAHATSWHPRLRDDSRMDARLRRRYHMWLFACPNHQAAGKLVCKRAKRQCCTQPHSIR
jgi:hypothetical protein